MYLSNKEADKLFGLIVIELSNDELVELTKSFEERVEFFSSDPELITNSQNIETLAKIVPKEEFINKIKEIRPDLTADINKIIES